MCAKHYLNTSHILIQLILHSIFQITMLFVIFQITIVIPHSMKKQIQRGQVIFPWSHSKLVLGQGFKSRQFDSSAVHL
jgi:hypothetical protein